MKQFIFFAVATMLVFTVNGQQQAQQLSVGNSDRIVTESIPYDAFLVESGQQSFFWISGSSFTNINHPMLIDVQSDFANVFFIKYNEAGDPVSSNYLRGTAWATDGFSYEGGLKILASASNDVSSEGDVLPIGPTDWMEFIASYDNTCKLNGLVKIWNLQPSQYPNSEAVMDKTDGSLYVYGIYQSPLELLDYGMIGEQWIDEYVYVIKYNKDLQFEWVATSGFGPGFTEVGNFLDVLVHPTAGRGIFISGSFDAMGMGPIIEGDMVPQVDNGFGLFGFKLDAAGKKQWVQHGRMNGMGYKTGIHKGIAMDDGGLVFAGVTTTGYFSLGNMEVLFDGGDGFLNQFVYRMGPEGDMLWLNPFPTMVLVEQRKKGVESETFNSEFSYDAFDWNKRILYLTGTFSNSAFKVADRTLLKILEEGIFIASINLSDGNQNWGYSISSDNLGIHGFDGDRFGNVTLMGRTTQNQYFEVNGATNIIGKDLIFHLGLDYNGRPMWMNNVYLQENQFDLYGDDLEVLGNGQVFSSVSQNTTDYIEVGDTSLFVDANYANWLVAFKSHLNLAGTVTDEQGSPVYPGYLKVFKSAVRGKHPAVDSVALNDAGQYVISDLWPGRVTLQVSPDPIAYPNAIPTYLGGQLTWKDALYNNYGPEEKETALDVVIMEIPRPTPDGGSGDVSGSVNYEEEGQLKGTLARPVKKATVLLAKRPVALKSTQSLEIVTYVETDEFGNFHFEFIPDGEYLLIIDIAGLEMIETHKVYIEGDQIKSGLDYTVGPDGIYTWTGVGISTEETDQFMVFPNPGNGQIYMELPAMGDYLVKIFNTDGRLVFSRQYHDAQGFRSIDMSEQFQGIYVINIEGPDLSATVKYVKR